ncbi:MAG: DCC1-like thiol-disulfide oxidoreductase family protein [Candidatus Dormibacteraceae bacterium]
MKGRAGGAESAGSLVYDSACDRCSRWAARAARGPIRLDLVPAGSKAAVDELGVSAIQSARSVWLVTRAGERLEGAAAINAILRLRGGIGGALAALADLPLLSQLEAGCYRLFARQRVTLSRPSRATGGRS